MNEKLKDAYENGIKVDAKGFKAAYTYAASAVSKLDTRGVLQGILFDFENNDLILVGSDAYRLHTARFSGAVKHPEEFAPRVYALATLPKPYKLGRETYFLLQPQEKELIITGLDGSQVSTRPMEGEFFDWRNVLYPTRNQIMEAAEFYSFDPTFISAATKGIGTSGRRTMPVSFRFGKTHSPVLITCENAWGHGTVAESIILPLRRP